MKLLIKLIALALATLGSVVVVRALLVPGAPAVSSAAPRAPRADTMVNDSAAAVRLARAVRFPTVSWTDSGPPREALLAMQRQLALDFPRVHRALAREVVPPANLLFTWKGSDTTLAPVVIMGHLDVVPVEAAALSRWHHAPFSGDIADGFIWGRGTLDDKVSVLAALEAVETMLAEGFQPERTVYFAFGDDEEVAGSGADSIVQRFKTRGVHPLFVMDEGGAIVDGMLPGVRRPVAIVGIAEKGYASVVLTVEGSGGHSSMPPRQTAVGILAAGIAALEDQPFPAHLRPPAAGMFSALTPSLPFAQRALFANRWLFDPLIVHVLAKDPTSDAMLRTTTAPTMFQGSPKDNVLPQRARAVVNFRILPGDSVADVLEHVRRVVDDSRVVVSVDARSATEPSPVSGTDTPGFAAISEAIRARVPSAIVAPWLVVGATDSRHYKAITRDIYRFLPVEIAREDAARVHGVDERVGVQSYGNAVRFMRQLLRVASRGGTAP